MESKIAELIRLGSQPVAILSSDVPEDDVLQFKEGVWGCTVAMLVAASRGKTAMFSNRTVACIGAKTGLGFQDYPHGWGEFFLSDGGGIVREPEHYKKTPALARTFMDGIRRHDGKEYLFFKPLSRVGADEHPLSIVFLVNADQISGLTVLANYDRETQDGVRHLFGAGCMQSVLYPMVEEIDGGHCFIGLTDPSARLRMPKDLLSFGIPCHRYLAMEAQAEESFLTKPAWVKLARRIGE